MARRFNAGYYDRELDPSRRLTAESYAEDNLPHTYVSELIHCVFSAKQRRNLISLEIQPRLWSFLGGIARKNGFKAIIVGGA